MSELDPSEIFNQFKKGKIEALEFLEILKKILENSENIEKKIECLDLICEIDLPSEELYNTLEKHLNLEKNSFIKAFVIEKIVLRFQEKGMILMEKIVETNSSILVLKKILDLTRNSDNNQSKRVYFKLLDRLATIYKIVREETPFLLDLHAIEIKTEEFYNRRLDPKNFDPILFMEDFNVHFDYYYVRRGHVKALNLNSHELSVIPDTIECLTRLKYLDLSHNGLTTLPKSIYSICYLKSLNLAHNSFSHLPDFWDKFKILTHLNLTGNTCLKELPNSLFQLSQKSFTKKYIRKGVDPQEAAVLGLLEILSGRKLKRFRINQDIYSDHGIACGYKIDANGHIISIAIQHREQIYLEIFPSQICSLKNLEELRLVINKIKSIPNDINKLKNLRILDLSYNKIHHIPETLFELKFLKILDLNGNNIEIIPHSIGNLQSLTELDLGYNRIMEIPEALFNIKTLKILHLNQNQIKELSPSISKLNSLEKLYVHANQLESIPDELTRLNSLEYLNLGKNKIQKIPVMIINLKNLKKLELSSNKIETIPLEIKECASLESLGLGNNLIREFPSFLQNLNSLKSLYLSNNKIKDLPENINFSSAHLIHLYLKNNPIGKIPNSIKELVLSKKIILL